MERAQKLAQDSHSALETYQNQVRTLEEQLARSNDLYVPPSSFFPLIYGCAAISDRNSLTILLQRSLRLGSRSARKNRRSSFAGSQKQTQRCPRAAIAQEKLVRSRQYREVSRHSGLLALLEISLVQTENDSNCTRFGGYRHSDVLASGVPCCAYLFSYFPFTHLSIYLSYYFPRFFHMVKLNSNFKPED